MSDTRPREPNLLKIYHCGLGHHDTVGLVHAGSKSYWPGRLERLAAHADCRVRRAAVFALRFIGRRVDPHLEPVRRQVAELAPQVDE